MEFQKATRSVGEVCVSDEPIDPYWWCRHDEQLSQLFWEKVERPFLLEMVKKFDDPKFWEVPKKKPEQK